MKTVSLRCIQVPNSNIPSHANEWERLVDDLHEFLSETSPDMRWDGDVDGIYLHDTENGDPTFVKEGWWMINLYPGAFAIASPEEFGKVIAANDPKKEREFQWLN